jgi:hypothetical protein
MQVKIRMTTDVDGPADGYYDLRRGQIIDVAQEVAWRYFASNIATVVDREAETPQERHERLRMAREFVATKNLAAQEAGRKEMGLPPLNTAQPAQPAKRQWFDWRA